MSIGVVDSSRLRSPGSSHEEQNLKQSNKKRVNNLWRYQCFLDLLLTERIDEKLQEMGRQIRQFLRDSAQADQSVKYIIPNRPLPSSQPAKQSLSVFLQRVLALFEEIYVEMMTSVDGALQQQGCSERQRSMVKATLTPERLLEAYQEVQTHHQSSRDNSYPLRRQWIPDGEVVSFDLTLQQLMAIHLTNQVAAAQEHSIDNAFLDHLEAALLSSQALVRLISDQSTLTFRREYGHNGNLNGLFSGGHDFGQRRSQVVTPLAERPPVAIPVAERSPEIPEATLVLEFDSSQEKVVVVDPRDVSPVPSF